MAEEGQKVSLHVYDLSQGLARQVSSSFLGKAIEGIWHTGIVVYGNEYYFGGGIQQAPVGTAPYGTPLKMVDLGVTKVPKDAFESYLKEISPRYTQETYSIMKHNCNNFSNEVAQYLVGTNIPEYILNLPNEVLSSPLAPLMSFPPKEVQLSISTVEKIQYPNELFDPYGPTSYEKVPMIHNLEATLREGEVPQYLQVQPPNGSSESSNTQPSDAKNSQPEVDPLGNARSAVQDEIAKEFAAIRAKGTMSPSEAAALATKNVMQKYGFINGS